MFLVEEKKKKQNEIKSIEGTIINNSIYVLQNITQQIK